MGVSKKNSVCLMFSIGLKIGSFAKIVVSLAALLFNIDISHCDVASGKGLTTHADHFRIGRPHATFTDVISRLSNEFGTNRRRCCCCGCSGVVDLIDGLLEACE